MSSTCKQHRRTGPLRPRRCLLEGTKSPRLHVLGLVLALLMPMATPADAQVAICPHDSDHCGVMGGKGNWLLEPAFTSVSVYPDKGVIITKNAQGYGAYDLKGRVVLPNKYGYLWPRGAGVFAAQKEINGPTRHIDKTGRELPIDFAALGLQKETTTISDFDGGTAWAFDFKYVRKAALIDASGKYRGVDVAGAYGIDGCQKGRCWARAGGDGKYGVIDKSGKWVAGPYSDNKPSLVLFIRKNEPPATKDAITIFEWNENKRHFALSNDGKWLLKGLPAEYVRFAPYASAGRYYYVIKRDGISSLVDSNSKTVASSKRGDPALLTPDVFGIQETDKARMVDAQGRTIADFIGVDARFSDANDLNRAADRYVLGLDYGIGAVDISGKWRIPPGYDGLSINPDRSFVARLGKRQGLIDADGKAISPDFGEVVAAAAERAKAGAEGRCEDVKKILERFASTDDTSNCIFLRALGEKSPRPMYVAAAKLEAAKARDKAKRIYMTILDRFANDDLAVDASKRLTALGDVEAKETSDRAAQEAAERAQRAAEDTAKAAREAEATRQRAAVAESNKPCAHVYVGKRIETKGIFGIGIMYWEVVGFSAESQNVTIRDANRGSGSMGSREITCSQVPR